MSAGAEARAIAPGEHGRSVLTRIVQREPEHPINDRRCDRIGEGRRDGLGSVCQGEGVPYFT